MDKEKPFDLRCQELKQQVENGHFRCAFGFLSALQTALKAQSVGLLRKHTSLAKAQIIHEVKNGAEGITFRQLEQIDQSITELIDQRLEESAGGAWKLRWRAFGYVSQNPVFRNISKKFLRNTLKDVIKQKTRRPLFKYARSHLSLSRTPTKIELKEPFVIQRVWDLSHRGGNTASEKWVYVLNPIRPDLHLDKINEIQNSLEDLLELWFSSKSSAIQSRHWRLGEGKKPAVQIRNIHEQSMVLPVSPSDFCHFLVDFSLSDDHSLKSLAETERFANTICFRNKIICASCDAKCWPRQQKLQSHIKPLAKLDRWNHFKPGQPIDSIFLAGAIDGLLEAARLLNDSTDTSVDFCAEGEMKISESDMEDRPHFLHERKLLRAFLARAIGESCEKLRPRWYKQLLQCQALNYPAALASLATVLLGDQPWTAERIETLIEVLAGYAHQIINVPERLNLAMHLRQTLRGETALHTLRQRYRDHFFHTVEVCLIGNFLLRSYPNSSRQNALVDVLVAKGKPKTNAALIKIGAAPNKLFYAPRNSEDFMANWWLAALTHDTAYGIDVLQGALKLLEFFKNHESVGKFVENTKECVSTLANQLAEIAPELKGDKSIVNGDHGLIAAGHLNKSLEYIGMETLLRFQPAVRAVAFHNARHPRVVAHHDPVAALLILCDTIQDWSRSQLGFTRSAGEVLSRIVEGGETPTAEQFGPVEAYFFSIRSSEKPAISSPGSKFKAKKYFWRKKNTLRIQLQYAPWTTKRLDCREKVILNWADTTYNLQRVNYRGWGLNLEIVHRTPFAQGWKLADPQFTYEEKMASELERFAAMVQEQSSCFLKTWLQTVADGNSRAAISYFLPPIKNKESSPCRWEELTFHLCELSDCFFSGRPLMAGQMRDFAQVVERWSKRLIPSADHKPEQMAPI